MTATDVLPVIQGRSVESLNGRWQCSPGGKDAPPAVWDHTVPVPGLIDLAHPSYPWQSSEYHWYRAVCDVPARYAQRQAFLRIDQAMFGTEVWLNGRRVGGDIACYTSQEYCLTGLLRYGGQNDIMVRVGSRNTLPPESAVGKDQERTEFIPGIWGDVSLAFCGNPRVKRVQVIPHIDTCQAEARITLDNPGPAGSATVLIEARVVEKKGRHAASPVIRTTVDAFTEGETVATVFLPLSSTRLWSVEDPFLYDLHVLALVDGNEEDGVVVSFGMREFKVAGSAFLLNGRRIFLRGGNIAFHRFLSDPDRGRLPWDPAWIRKALVDIPRAHHFNFFRFHLGQPYSRWLEIADEYGMLIQNEWQFWTTSGSREQIRSEFTRWIQDNWNHPSIIIWDALNECTDDVVLGEVIPEMKKLDPTRPWEPGDVTEHHPYIYSLGPVLNDRQFGFTASMADIEHSKTPAMVNEFVWWWLDKRWEPTVLTREVLERWLGPGFTREELIERQSFLAQELVELFRRMSVSAIQPFVYISNNGGPTANWFIGDIKDLQPKPVMRALKNAFAPFGLSIELWDRHFFTSEERNLRIFVFNDCTTPRKGTLRYGIRNSEGRWISSTAAQLLVEPGTTAVLPVSITMPAEPGDYSLMAELEDADGGDDRAVSEKVAYVFDHLTAGTGETGRTLGVVGSREIAGFLAQQGFSVVTDPAEIPRDLPLVVLAEEEGRKFITREKAEVLTAAVEEGTVLVLVEPEYGIQGSQALQVLRHLSLTITRRDDPDKGGYDSYLFAGDHESPLWNGIGKNHLQMFNGGLGGEVVSQHDVMTAAGHRVLARCGLQLRIAAVFEIPCGKGRVVVSRLQLRGRLLDGTPGGSLFARRTDPVLQRYLLNLVKYALTAEP